MPIIKSKRRIAFTEEEKELIDKMIELIGEIDCDVIDLPCDRCPFKSLCCYDYAYIVEKQINRILNTNN